MKLFHLASTVLLLAAGACGIVIYPSPTETPELIGTLRSHDHTIYLYAGKFSVTDANGEVLADLVTEEEFQRSLPDVYVQFQRMFAGGPMMATSLNSLDYREGPPYCTVITPTTITIDP